MARRIFGIIIGVICALLTLTIIERVAGQWLPEAGDNDLQRMLAVLLAWFMGGLIGTWVATLMDPQRGPAPAIWVVVIMIALTLFYALDTDHPLWFDITGLLVYLPAAWLGIRSARPRVGKK